MRNKISCLLYLQKLTFTIFQYVIPEAKIKSRKGFMIIDNYLSAFKKTLEVFEIQKCERRKQLFEDFLALTDHKGKVKMIHKSISAKKIQFGHNRNYINVKNCNAKHSIEKSKSLYRSNLIYRYIIKRCKYIEKYIRKESKALFRLILSQVQAD